MRKTHRFKTLRQFVDSFPRGVTQSRIARQLGLSEASLSGYLGGRIPGRETALRLARDHGIDLEGLLDPPQGSSGDAATV